MELVLGKKFKLEVWEVIVQKMSLNEVAKFTVHKTVSFPSPSFPPTCSIPMEKGKRIGAMEVHVA